MCRRATVAPSCQAQCARPPVCRGRAGCAPRPHRRLLLAWRRPASWPAATCCPPGCAIKRPKAGASRPGSRNKRRACPMEPGVRARAASRNATASSGERRRLDRAGRPAGRHARRSPFVGPLCLASLFCGGGQVSVEDDRQQSGPQSNQSLWSASCEQAEYLQGLYARTGCKKCMQALYASRVCAANENEELPFACLCGRFVCARELRAKRTGRGGKVCGRRISAVLLLAGRQHNNNRHHRRIIGSNNWPPARASVAAENSWWYTPRTHTIRTNL